MNFRLNQQSVRGMKKGWFFVLTIISTRYAKRILNDDFQLKYRACIAAKILTTIHDNLIR